MTNENLQPSVSQMLRMTGANTSQFMEQVALHLEKLEAEVDRLSQRIQELEGVQNGSK
jgi:outer membrane murein-binding lipoprotein Lpp